MQTARREELADDGKVRASSGRPLVARTSRPIARGGPPGVRGDAETAPPDRPALKPYWGKPAVRNFREGDGNVGIIRSPVRAIVLPEEGDIQSRQAKHDQSKSRIQPVRL